MKTIRYTGLIALLVLGLSFTAEQAKAQDLDPSRRLSPLGMARAFVGDAYVKVTYGRPYKRGRDNIFGADESSMHAYGEMWRFGANEPTEISFSAPVRIGEEEIGAGTYSIFARPGEDTWTLYFNSLKGGGAGDYDEAMNVVEYTAPVSTLDEEMNQFTIGLEEQGEGVHMVTSWLSWKVEVPIMPAQ